MANIIFILGGAKSGKSTYAINLAKSKNNKKVCFIATGLPLDREMKHRIKLHKKTRPPYWKTYEAPKDLVPLFKKICIKFDVLIIDCLTLFISNLILSGFSDKMIEDEILASVELLKKQKCSAIIVSNEVGLGIVPINKLARRFRDLAGRINQVVAGYSDEMFFMVSGIPMRIK